MQKITHYDIAIVGGGMVGASLACLLAARVPHLRIALLEASETLPPLPVERFDARVVALSNKAITIFEQAGVWPGLMSDRIQAYRGMHVWDGEGTASVSFKAGDIRENQLGFIVENALIVRALWQALEELPNVEIYRGASLQSLESKALKSETQAQSLDFLAQGEAQRIRSALVIAADGARSQIREQLQFSVKEWDYGQSAIVTTVQTEAPHQQTAWQRFTENGPIALLPLGKTSPEDSRHFCSLVWSADRPLASKLMEESEDHFREQLGRAFEFKLGAILDVDERFVLPLQQRHAESYVLPGVALVGDAAHSIHPLAGQGVNLGLYDIQVLVEEIERAQQRSIPLYDFSLLQRYERRRQGHNLMAMATMEGFKQVFASQQPGLRWLRNTGMRLFNQQAWLKNKIVRLASG